jgi:hypothetical protein
MPTRKGPKAKKSVTVKKSAKKPVRRPAAKKTPLEKPASEPGSAFYAPPLQREGGAA